MTALAPASPVGVEAQECPPGAEQEFFEVGLEHLQPIEVVEEIVAGRSVTDDPEEEAVLMGAASNLELLPVAAKRPDFLVHDQKYRPYVRGR